MYTTKVYPQHYNAEDIKNFNALIHETNSEIKAECRLEWTVGNLGGISVSLVSIKSNKKYGSIEMGTQFLFHGNKKDKRRYVQVSVERKILDHKGFFLTKVYRRHEGENKGKIYEGCRMDRKDWRKILNNHTIDF